MTLYTGVTNDLRRRSSDHKNSIGSEFTARYHFDRCVYFETFESILGAISREKQIKGLTRAKKIALIKTLNPQWRDLSPPIILSVAKGLRMPHYVAEILRFAQDDEGSIRATTTVMSSPCAPPPRKRSTSRTMASRTSAADASPHSRTTASIRSMP